MTVARMGTDKLKGDQPVIKEIRPPIQRCEFARSVTALESKRALA